MKYMGSKARIAKHILPIMLEEAYKQGLTTWVEPFVGGANVIDKVPDNFRRIGIDLNPHTISAILGIRDCVDLLPSSVDESYYKSLKGKDPSPIDSWIRFECSFASKFDNGFAKNKQGRNYAEKGKNLALKQSPKLQSVEFICCSYKDYVPENSLVYCDPPYQGTTGYKTGTFDHEDFFQWCRDIKKSRNTVFVSEYNAPNDFECVWQGNVKTNFSSGRTEATNIAVEKLFKV